MDSFCLLYTSRRRQVHEQGLAACGVWGDGETGRRGRWPGSPKRDSQGTGPLGGCGQSPPVSPRAVSYTHLIASTGINPDTRVKDLSENEISALRDYIDHHLKVEGDLRREVSMLSLIHI